MDDPISRLRGRIIGDWRLGWRFWSVRLQALTVASATILIAAPDSATMVWQAIPADVRAMIPVRIARWLPILFGALAMAARFVRQKRADDDG